MMFQGTNFLPKQPMTDKFLHIALILKVIWPYLVLSLILWYISIRDFAV